MTIILFGGGPMFGLPELSPFVMKSEVQLAMAGLPFQKRIGRREDAPKGQLPWIEDDGVRIGDSTFIRGHIERTYGADLDAGLNFGERAQAWTLERMLENHLNWVAAYYRFMVPENFEKGAALWFEQAPEAMRGDLKRGLLDAVGANLLAVGVTRHTPDEIALLGERSLSALSTALGDKPYLFGDAPSGTDAFAFALTAGLLAPFFSSALRDAALRHENLVAYAARMMGRFYPGFGWEAG